jgi:hypothetical protein
MKGFDPIPAATEEVADLSKAIGLRLGLLINFNVGMIKEGIKRIVR